MKKRYINSGTSGLAQSMEIRQKSLSRYFNIMKLIHNQTCSKNQY